MPYTNVLSVIFPKFIKYPIQSRVRYTSWRNIEPEAVVINVDERACGRRETRGVRRTSG